MSLFDITRGVAFRVAALTTFLILVSMATLGAVVYHVLDDALEARVAQRIEQQMAQVLASAQPGDINNVIAEIEKLTPSGSVPRFSYRIIDANRRHVAGDPSLNPGAPGWIRQPVTEGRESTVGSRQMLVLTSRLGDDLTLSIGRDIQWISDVEDELLVLLCWALFAGLVFAALTAIFTSRLVAHRIDLVVGSAVAIMNGNLKHRVPVTGARDDFDRLSDTLNELLDRIQGLIANIEQVTNDIAHDLRTPLGRLRQGLEQARFQATTTEAYAQAVERAMAEADGLLATFTAMLRIAQVEAGASRSAFRMVDLSDVMRSVAEAYELDAEEKGHRLETALTGGVQVSGDRDLLAQMFANLIENALMHTPRGATIRVSLEHTPGGVVATVADDGPGVPAAERGKIFQRFYRLEASRTTPGTGLGLSLVLAVAKLHAAQLVATDNQPGLQISLTFPQDLAAVQAQP